MKTPTPQDLKRLALIEILQWRIGCIRARLEKCQACTPKSRSLMLKLVTLVQRRNDLRAPADVAEIEKERGLV